MADQTTDPVIDAQTAPVDQANDESIFGTPNLEPLVLESVTSAVADEVQTTDTAVVKGTTTDDDKLLVQTLSDNGIATLQEVKKLFERVQTLEEDNRKLQEIVSSKNIEIKDLTTQTAKVDDLEIAIGELHKKVDTQYTIIQKVRQEADKNMFTKGYTISEDVLSLVKNITK